jgi:DNA-binding response OmpR family regulator
MAITPSLRVLHVDDNADCRDMLSSLLKFSKIETQSATTAAQALSMIEAERFDLYLLEAWLPELDGFELCRRMRSSNPQTPILFFSAAAYEGDKKKAIEAGADAYVAKPDIDALLGSIEHFALFANRNPSVACLDPTEP